MATSGTSSFNFNRDQIIKAALRKIGAIAAGETPDAQTISDCADQLNTMMKSLAATGLHIWTETEATLFMQTGQASYSLGGTIDNATESYTATTLASAAANGASSVSISSATGVATGYNIGIVLDGGSIFWTTVSNLVSTTVTLGSPLTDSASAGNAVYVYQTQIIRPLRVVSARRSQLASALDTQMLELSRIDYRNMPNKLNTGTITQWFYDPRGGANATGQFFVWPAPSDVGSAVKFTWYRPLQDFTSAATNPDIPQEWLDALVWNLALKMAPEYDCSANRYEIIKDQAASSLDNVMGWDREPESYLFGADLMLR